MKEILKTTLLEFDKSTFLIDLVKHEGGKIYISILQTIHLNEQPPMQQEIRINPSLLDEMLEVLVSYQNYLPKVKQKKSKQWLSKVDQDKIQNRYLKGISIKDIAMQFDCPEELMIQVLQNRGIEIVPDNTNELKKIKNRKKNK